MRLKRTLAGAALVAGAALAPAAPAHASIPLCAGTQNTIVVCVDPTGGILYQDCVYAGPPPCTPVSIPGPTIQCGGNIGQNLCAFNYADPGPPIN
ncbi:MAG TPA: hypothetical protein VHI71_02840 [Actinomycetota bacterium]|nr:hypothetical protein [Actinomycetota bacterium]